MKLLQKTFSGLMIMALILPYVSVSAEETNILQEATPPEQVQVKDISLESTDATTDLNIKEVVNAEDGVNVSEQPSASQQLASANPYILPSGVKTPDVTYQQKIKTSVDVFSGALTQSIPIEIPSGRNGIQPNLTLDYNNQNQETVSHIGYGWSLSIPYIERLNKTGLDRLYIDNYFTSSLSGELATTSTASQYRAKFENGDFLQYEFTNNTWTVEDKRGVSYTFGAMTNDRQYAIGNTASTTKWMLSEVRDTNNNFYRYEYVKHGNEIYPSKVLYTGHNITDGIYSVDFVLENRPDTYLSYKSGYQVDITKRIKEIVIKVNNIERGKYTLGYTSGFNGTRSLLASVTESRISHTSQVTTLPPTTFQYTSDAITYVKRDDNANIATRDGYFQPGRIVVDIDGNGLNERLFSTQITQGTWISNGQLDGTLNLGNNSTQMISKVVPRPWTFIDNTYGTSYEFLDYGTRVFDVNGDMLPDIIGTIGPKLDPDTQNVLYTNIGNTNFASTTLVNFSPAFKLYEYIGSSWGRSAAGLLLNLNGDQIVDTYSTSTQCDVPRGPGPFSGYCSSFGGYSGTGSGWKLPNPQNIGWQGQLNASSQVPENIFFGDVNGDGLDDLIRKGEGTTTVAYLNIGNNTWSSATSTWVIPHKPQSGLPGNFDAGVRVLDINGDGLVDIIRSYNVQTWQSGWWNLSGVNAIPPAGNFQVAYINTGSSWVQSSTTPVFGVVDGMQIQNYNWYGKMLVNDSYFDANGDGLVDFGNNIRQGRKPDVLIKTTYSTGGTVDVEYKPTPQHTLPSSTTQAHPKLPSVIYTVTKLTKNAGSGVTEVTDYAYEGGLNDFRGPNNLKFAGFKKVTETQGTKKKVTYFHQGNDSDSNVGEQSDQYAKIGKPFREDITDLTNSLYLRTWYTWQSTDKGNGSWYTYLTDTVEQAYDGNTTHKDVATSYTYSTTTGNVLTETKWGEVTGGTTPSFSDTGNDKRVTSFSYANNCPFFVPTEISMVNNAGVLTQKTKLYYDNLSFGNVTLGNNTKTEKYTGTSTFIATTKSYDLYGLVTHEYDANNNQTTFSYDAYNLYQDVVTNALSQNTSYTYDYNTGKTLTVTTPNTINTFTYDGFGRLLSESVQDESASTVLKNAYVYTDTVNAVSVKKSSYLDGSNVVDSYTYLDGFGRTIQTKQEAEGNSWITSDTVYNNEGKVQKQSLPYFTSASTKSTATTTTALLTNFTYDSLQRAATQANAVGITVYQYDDWRKTVTDPLLRSNYYYNDAFGNLSKVTESMGLIDYHTLYEYDANNKLTKITDANGNVRNFTYDLLGRQLTAEDIHAPADTTFGTYSYQYDDQGNVIQKTISSGTVITYTYDDLNRVETEDSNSAAGTEIIYTYDSCANGVGFLCTTTRPKISTSLSYTKDGKVSQMEIDINKKIFSTSFNYNRQGNISRIVNPNKVQIDYSFNDTGLVENIYRSIYGSKAMAIPVISNINYAPTGLPTLQVNSNGTETCFTYDSTKLYRLLTKKTVGLGTNCAPGQSQMMMFVPSGVEENTKQSLDLLIAEGKAVKNEKDEIRLVTPEIISQDENGINTILGYTKDGDTIYEKSVYVQSSSSKDFSTENRTVLIGKEGDSFSVGTTLGTLLSLTKKGETITVTPVTEGELEGARSSIENGIVFSDVFAKGKGIEVLYRDGVIVKDVVIDSKEDVDEKVKTQSFTFKIADDSVTAIVGKESLNVDDVVTTDDSFIIQKGKAEFLVYAPKAVANKSSEQIPVKVTLERKKDGLYITKEIPTEWLLAEGREYPVRADLSFLADPTVYQGALYFGANSYTPDPNMWTNTRGNVIGYVYPGANYVSTEVGSSPQRVEISRFFMSFNTASLPDDAILQSARLDLNGQIYSTTVVFNDSDYVAVVEGKQGTSTNLVATDYPKCGTTLNDSAIGGKLKLKEVTTNKIYPIPLNSNASLWINKTGHTQLCIREKHDLENTPPIETGNNIRRGMYINSNQYPSQRSKLVIEYVVPTATTTITSFDTTVVTTLTSPLSSSTIHDLAYTYDAVGNILSISDASVSSTSPKFTYYTYDPLNRLTSAVSSSTQESFTYDGIGNILTRNGTPYLYQTQNLTNPHAVTQVGSTTLAYDTNGNVSAINEVLSTTVNVWNYRNELTSTTKSSSTVEYLYDHEGTRVEKSTNGLATFYPSPYFTQTSTGTSTTLVMLGNENIATIQEGSVLFNHTDHLGSTVATTNQTGEIVETTDYSAFGHQISRSTFQNTSQTKKYTGHTYDPETDLLYAQARYYRGSLGRFLSQDKVSYVFDKDKELYKNFLSNPQVQNTYSYALNNPIKYTDPTGNCVGPLAAVCIAGAAWLGTVEGVVTMGTISSTVPFWTSQMAESADTMSSPNSTATDKGFAGLGMLPVVGGFGTMAKTGIVLRQGDVVSGLKVTRHAAEQFSARNMDLSQIDNAIKHGAKYVDTNKNTLVHVVGEKAKGGYTIVTDRAQKVLVTVQNFVQKLSSDRYKVINKK